eukprot:8726_1
MEHNLLMDGNLADIIWNTSYIHHKQICIVEGYIRENTTKTPQDVTNVILFFYAKPIYIHITHEKELKRILYYPLNDNWISITDKVQKQFNLKMSYNQYIQFRYGFQNNIIIDETNFQSHLFNKREYSAELSDANNINIISIFKKSNISLSILSYLRLSNLLVMSLLSNWFYRRTHNYYRNCISLDLSEFFGIIGGSDFDNRSFMNTFLPKFKSVQSLS